jgi:UDP-N-acetylglucosamine 2-epimerase (non-hydrolysing)
VVELQFACVVGARPNFMKMAPLLRAFEQYKHVRATLIHTGQHYDEQLSGVFFSELGMKRPDVSLDVGSGMHGAQTARILEKFEKVLDRGSPCGKSFDRVVVVGDVNSTMAAALAAAKVGVPVAHVEAGLRSFDRSMPEEINRIVTDAISDMLLVSEAAAVENLRREGHCPQRIHMVGNVMIDTLLWLLPKAHASEMLCRLRLEPGRYGVVTLHRPANVDQPRALAGLLDVLLEISHGLPLVFPVHPRTRQRIEDFGLLGKLRSVNGSFRLLPPLGYLDFLALTSQAKAIVTDSGGLQDEATALGIPCLTTRSNTERPSTVDEGSSILVGNDCQKLRDGFQMVLDGGYKRGRCPQLWDGHAAERIAAILAG